MKVLTEYSKLTGAITRVLYVPDDYKHADGSADLGYLDGAFDDDEYEVVAGTPQQKPKAPTPAQPKAGEEGDPGLTDEEVAWRNARVTRNALLQASDWTQLPDVPLATKEAWAEYRQALRDITNQPDPFNIVWPVPPG